MKINRLIMLQHNSALFVNIFHVYFVDSGKYITESEGNCFRFFALQAVGKDAMRRTLDSMPENFEQIWDRFEKYCKQRKGKFLECMYN